MEPKQRERILERVRERKRSYDIGIPSLPNPPKYYTSEVEHIEDDDEIFQVLETLPIRFKEIWRRGSIEMPGLEAPIFLYRMPQYHQKVLLRNGGDATGCGKVWGAGLIFPVFSVARDSPIHRILSGWIRSSFVVEVGSGWSGTAGITAYRMGASTVALTDGEEVMVESLGVNAAAAVGMEMSGVKISTSPRPNSVYPITEGDGNAKAEERFWVPEDEVRLNSPLTAHRLRWGHNSDCEELFRTAVHAGMRRKCDLVVGCDCIHDANSVDSLLLTISQHLDCDRIFLCWESTWQRMDGEDLFLRRLLELGYRIKYSSASVLADLALLHDDDVDSICAEIRSEHLESKESELNVLAAERDVKSMPTQRKDMRVSKE